MQPHKCHDLLAHLSEYLDGTLSPELCTVLEEHLKTCENCRVVINTMQKTIELYRVVGESQNLPPDIRERLFRRLNLDEYLTKHS